MYSFLCCVGIQIIPFGNTAVWSKPIFHAINTANSCSQLRAWMSPSERTALTTGNNYPAVIDVHEYYMLVSQHMLVISVSGLEYWIKSDNSLSCISEKFWRRVVLSCKAMITPQFCRYAPGNKTIKHTSRDRIIFNMGISILVRRHLYIETVPCSLETASVQSRGLFY